MRNTIIINLFAGPGSGKSTGAAYIFFKIKDAWNRNRILKEIGR